MSTITDIADAVAAELNGGSFGQPFTARRHYRPVFELAQMQTLHVTVVPAGVAIQAAGRNLLQRDFRIDVAIQRKFNAGDAEELDPLMALVEEIAAFFHLRRLTTYPQAAWVQTANEPLYSLEHMEQFRQFTSVLSITFRVIGPNA